MVNFTIDQLREIMDNQDNIRNMSVIAHVDHGKSTLTDSLIAKAGIIAQDKAGDARYMDTRKDEQTRGITIKSTGVSLYYEYPPLQKGEEMNMEQKKTRRHLINLIDSPGHVDFSSEVTAALRVTDGALVVVDYVEGVCVQTETVLRQALMELIRPCLMINKVDRAFFELEHEAETIYQNFQRVIESFNVIVSTYQKTDLIGECQVDPTEGNVCMGSALHGWGFSLMTFARMYNTKFKIELSVMRERLWGDNFYSAKGKYSDDIEDEYPRAFCQLALAPIMKLAKNVREGKKDLWLEMCKKIGVQLTKDEEELEGKKIVRMVMQRWINASEALIEMIICHLPSPRQAQKYRTLYLYEGPMDDECAKGMMACDPEGPFMMFISKMVPSGDGGRFYAFGRVFSGKAECSKKVKIMSPNYLPGKNEERFEKNIQRVVLMMGRRAEDVFDVPCGNTCALVGVDSAILKQATISDSANACIIRSMKYSVSPVVRIAIKPKNAADLPKLIEGMKKMSKSDPLVVIHTSETENIIAGCGELHLEICLQDLCNEYTNIEIIKSDPVVPYKETVTDKSTQMCMTKSANKHNRIYITAEPLDEELVLAIEDETFKTNEDVKKVGRKLVDDYSWDKAEAMKVWCFGPENVGPNMLVDTTKAVQYLLEIKDSMVSAFQWATKEGIIAEETVRGCRYNIMDVELHTDAIHRGGNQIIQTARRVFLASQFTASPRFVEPIFLVDVAAPTNSMGGVYQCFNQRRGIVFSEETVPGTPMINAKAYLPVSESFGFTADLRSKTSGQAFPQCMFDHWEMITDDPFQPSSIASVIMMGIRKRKGIKQEIPKLEDYVDKK
jgi:elongation factor 2